MGDEHDLITIVGLRPEPQSGEILEAVRGAQASGEVTTRAEALSFIHGIGEEMAKETPVSVDKRYD